jgi:hypothetical protein
MNVESYQATLAAAVRRWFADAKVEVTTSAETMAVSLFVLGRTPQAGLVRRVPLLGEPLVVEARAREVAQALLEELGVHRLVLRRRARQRFAPELCPDVILVDRRGRVTVERAHHLLETRASLDEYLRAHQLVESDLRPA